MDISYAKFKLSRDMHRKLVLFDDECQQKGRQVIAVRAFPISAVDKGIALVDHRGNELIWIENLQDLPVEWRDLIEEELASRDFMPEIKQIDNVSSFITPCVWWVNTDRGNTCFTLKGEEAIRRLSSAALLITDQYGVHFLIRDRTKLDHHSAKLLDRFL